MEVSFYLKRPNGEALTAVYARIYYSGYETKFYLPETSIAPNKWNRKARQARQTYPGYAVFNNNLKLYKDGIIETIREYKGRNDLQPPEPNVLKQLLKEKYTLNKTVAAPVTFVSFFTDYVDKCRKGVVTHAKTGKPLTSGTIRSYNTTLFNVNRYIAGTGNKADFQDINLGFYASFTDYLATFVDEDSKKQKQSLNTIGKHIKIIKSILNEATEQGVNINLAYKNKRFLTLSEDADTVYLNEKELKKIEELNLLNNSKLDHVRDLFLVGAMTGLRFSDLSTLTADQIVGNMITITQIKTGHPVVIPLHSTVKKIMEKYNGALPPAISNQKTNEYLKDLCKIIAELKILVSVSGTIGGVTSTEKVHKWELISTHTARRSFATNEYLAGTPILTIMAITGHKTEKAFLRYIRITPDQHAKILAALWEKRHKIIEEQVEA